MENSCTVKMVEVDFDPFFQGEVMLTAPTTEAQKEIWASVQMGSEANCGFNESMSLVIKGHLDPEIFIDSVQDLISRHEILRATFSTDGTIISFLGELIINIPVLDFSNLESHEREKRLNDILILEVETPFDLEHGPLIRVTFIKMDEKLYRIVITAHHIICDGWSIAIILQELGSIYQARQHGVIPDIPEPCPFSEYAIEDKVHFESESGRETEQYWLSLYSGEVPFLNLPTTRPRPRQRTFDARRLDHQLPVNLVSQLKKTGAKAGCTFITILIAGFKSYLYRITGQNDLTLGTPAAGQSATGRDRLVGHCVNLLPLRSQISGEMPFSEFLKSIRNLMFDAYENQRYTFGRLITKLDIPREPGRIPLVPVIFNIDQKTNEDGFNVHGFETEVFSNPRRYENFELFINVTSSSMGDRVVVECTYNTNLFDEKEIQLRLQEYETVLRSICENPDQLINDLTLMPENELDIVLRSWNDTKRDYPLNTATLHGLFESAVDKYPDEVAVIYDNQKLTYRQLDEHSNQLANYLRTMGIKNNDVIAVLMERSLEMVIALYGILKAGGAYLPLDPGHPIKRIAYILEESGTKCVLSQFRFNDHLPAAAHRLHIDTQWKELSDYDSTRPANKTLPQDLAYVIYTSGSTGKPKGVMNEHRGICNRLLWMQENNPLKVKDKVLQKTPYTFDVSVPEFFSPLIIGACLIVAKPDGHKDTAYLIETIRMNQITYVHFVPSMLRLFLSDKNAGQCGSLTRVICSGEALSSELNNRFFSILPNTELYNLYGPTEAAVEVTAWKCSPDTSCSTVPIGKPIANTEIYILDEKLIPVPVGVVGELHIGGVQVARGYLNRPELTREKFIDNPFSNEVNARLYKTGDLAKYNSDGAIEYVGRNDHQVKIRGLRIELGEIETAINLMDNVNQCVVVAREDKEHDQRLVAYIVPEKGMHIDVSSLRINLAQNLPDYMVPQHFIEMESFPLTSSCKTDIKMLPSSKDLGAFDSHTFIAPSTEIEKIIATFWEEILDLKQIGIDDNFFDLGGHSLLAIQALAKINEKFGVITNLNTLFLAPTIRQLAELINVEIASGQTKKLDLSIPVISKDVVVPATSQQQRLWYLMQLSATYISAHNNASAFRLRGVLNINALQRAVNTIINRHEILRSNIRFEDEELIQTVRRNAHFDLQPISIQQYGANGLEDLIPKLQVDAAQPLDVSEDPLFKVQLVRIGENDHALLFIINHLVFDGWSYDLLFDELYEGYNAYEAGREPSLPALPSQYGDYAIWQKAFLQSTYLKNQINYWKDNLNGDLPLLELPLDKRRPPVQDYNCHEIRFAYDQNIVESLEKFGRSNGCTLFMVIIALYALMLHRFTRQREILVGTPISGRISDDISHLIGFFVNTLALRFKIFPEMNFSDWMNEVKDVCLNAYNNQDAPFELIVQELQPPRDMSRSPIFQTFFIYQDVRNRNMGFENLEMTNFNVRRTALQTDLDVWVKREKDRLWGGFLYATALFDENTAQKFVDSFVTLAEQVSNNPEISLKMLCRANDHEIQNMQVWNDTKVNLPSLSFLEIFTKCVEIYPNKTAIIHRTDQLSYLALERRANQISRYILSKGIEKGSLVGVCMDRSENLIAVLISIWKADCAYVPLDPDYPKARLKYMAETAGISLLVTEMDLVDRLADYPVKTIIFDTEIDKIEAIDGSTVNKHFNSAPEDLAYVIFTSGSTGKPKGVKIPHRALANFMYSMLKIPGFSNEDILLAVTTYSFDIAALELFLPLYAGATTVVIDKEYSSDGTILKKCLLETGATVMQATPSTWRILLESGWVPDRDFKILCGGEQFPVDLAIKLSESCENVWNMYGPTETTIWSSCHKINRNDKFLFIGRPIANTQMHVLDNDLQPLPVGVVGELYIGGAGVSKGYINRPDLTSIQFVEDPFSDIPGALLYKTGDLARYIEDGLIECFGRVDSQVKIRGYRIELGEIETILSQLDNISQAVVNVHEISAGDQRLIAYLVTDEGNTIDIKIIRESLGEQIPDYMIPQHFVTVDHIPLTPAGKVDRKALLWSFNSVPSSKKELYVPPSTETEKILLDFWQVILGLDFIGIHDNFFDVGGHSLLAVKLFSKIKKRFNVELPLATLFRSTTVHELASRIDAEMYTSEGQKQNNDGYVNREIFEF